jgi:hypothetical protein
MGKADPGEPLSQEMFAGAPLDREGSAEPRQLGRGERGDRPDAGPEVGRVSGGEHDQGWQRNFRDRRTVGVDCGERIARSLIQPTGESRRGRRSASFGGCSAHDFVAAVSREYDVCAGSAKRCPQGVERLLIDIGVRVVRMVGAPWASRRERKILGGSDNDISKSEMLDDSATTGDLLAFVNSGD